MSKCVVCGNPKESHGGMVIHPFTPEGTENLSRIFGKTPAGRVGGSGRPEPELNVTEAHNVFPFDPVLRLALINKGVIESEDLTRAEEMMKMIHPLD